MTKTSLFLAAALCLAAAGAGADEIQGKLQALAAKELKNAFNDPAILDAVKAQNERHAALGQPDIDTLDKQWRAEAKTGKGALIDRVLANEVSQRLKAFKESGQGLYTEIFVMDNRGLNVGQSDVTSDFWQGDEAKWKNTYLVGPDAMFIDEIEHDESTQTFQSQLSMSIKDPATGEVIGAITVGIDVEALM